VTPQKRLFDLVASSLGLVFVSPLLGTAALAIWLGDGGPVFYRQVRVGLGGREFRMWKFRTMVENADKLGGELTVGKDPRITPIGAVLRKYKVDELPQLFNVIAGDMSLVGPRPEVRGYVDLYSPAERQVLELVPGITDPASIKYRDESDLLATADDPERLYQEVIMPDKIRINLDYAASASLWSDLRTILATVFPRLPFPYYQPRSG
jgi:lipopolysaccharide/colanic/teichoic acid biosynthesis glycosyltransferase